MTGSWSDDNLSKIPCDGPNGNARLLLRLMALAFTAWPVMAAHVRGSTLQLRETQFIEAAKTSGTKDFHILNRPSLPTLFSIVMLALPMNISGTIVRGSGISYNRLGVQATGSSIGLIDAQASNPLNAYPWETLVPSLTLVINLASFLFIGDGLRERLSPPSKNERVSGDRYMAANLLESDNLKNLLLHERKGGHNC
nr:ABC transporter permease subunit [Dictyobacter formicarum]